MNLKNKLIQPRFLLISLTILGIGSLFFGFFQIKNTLQAPFPKNKNTESKPITQEEMANILKKQDTDKDGLSDYDEALIYKTSAFLADSDSDSYTDYEEIKANSNPLDPQSTPYRKKGSQESILEQTFKPSPSPSLEPTEEISAQEIRNLLIQNGLDQAIVDKVDDKTLKELYNETKKELGINPQAIGEQQTQFLELKPEEIRQLLLLGGADSKILEQVDDQTLKSLFEQLVQESR